MSEPVIARTPSPRLRAVGFVLAALGGLLAGLGTLLVWIEASLDDFPPGLSPTYLGVDLPDGLVVLALALAIVVAVLASRVGHGAHARRGAGVVVIIASFIVIGVAGAAIVTATARFAPTVIDDILAIVAPNGASPEQRAAIDELVDVRVGIGAWISLLGGVLALVGGVLTLAWATATAATAAPEV